ncbi:MAG TPA: hypothetical protein PKD54_01145 [Pirellulaceae bacterium]|nr:hypothetical protein [Pirellulaceae bacterium]
MNSGATEDELPQLHGAVVTTEQVQELIEDWIEHTDLLDVTIRPLSGLSTVVDLSPGSPERRLVLSELVQHLSDQRLKGIRVAYRFDQSEWIDTLSIQDQQIRLLRIRLP